MAVLRRRVAETAMRRRDVERQHCDPEQAHRIAELQQQLAAAIKAEEQLTVASQREQARADAFRTQSEVMKARYTVARTENLIEEASDQDSAEAAARLQDIIAVRIARHLGPVRPPP